MKKYQAIKNRMAARILEADLVERHVQERIVRAYPSSWKMEKFEINDVFLVGYPKSGNTWLQNLVTGLMYSLGGDNVPGHLVQELVPDVHYKSHYQRFSAVMCFKSHFLPKKEYRRVIYIVRDGRDALVSYWYYHKALTGEELDFEEMVDAPIYDFGTWSEHVEAWMGNPFNADMLLLKYEDLLQKGETQLKRICKFLNIDRSEEEIIKVYEANQFSGLKEKERKFGFGHGSWKTDEPFFRRGEIGGYMDEMPGNSIAKFNNANIETLRKLSYSLK